MHGAAHGSAGYTVQVAAYNTRSTAEKLRASLAARGYDARIVGSAKPYRVRVGRYESRAEAERAAAQMKSKKIAAFVTETEPR